MLYFDIFSTVLKLSTEHDTFSHKTFEKYCILGLCHNKNQYNWNYTQEMSRSDNYTAA